MLYTARTTESEARLLHVASSAPGRRSLVEILWTPDVLRHPAISLGRRRQAHGCHVNVHRGTVVRVTQHLLRLVACLHIWHNSTDYYTMLNTSGDASTAAGCCNFVSVDIWDGTNCEPVIYHGYTLTSKILVKDVLYTVREQPLSSHCVYSVAII